MIAAEHPDPINLTDVQHDVDELRACNDRLREIHLRALLREQARESDAACPYPVERDV